MSSVGLDTAVNSNLSVAAMASFPTAKPIASSSIEIKTEAGQLISFEPQQGMMAGNIARSPQHGHKTARYHCASFEQA